MNKFNAEHGKNWVDQRQGHMKHRLVNPKQNDCKKTTVFTAISNKFNFLKFK